LLTLLKFHKC